MAIIRPSTAYQQLLVATDLQEGSLELLGYAKALAALFHAPLSLVHVLEFSYLEPAGNGLMVPPVDIRNEQTAVAKERLAEVARKAELSEVKQYLVVGSNIASELVGLVEKTQTDLLVVGAREHKAWMSLFFSHTKQLVSHIRCDMLVTRLRHAPSA